MAKTELILSFCLLSSFALLASAASTFSVEGRVYCDTCRAGFETNITEYISGAKVKVECTHFSTGKVEHSNEGVTGANGFYHVEVVDDHEEEICEAVLVESPVADCKEIPDGRHRAQVVLAANTGITSNVRFANSLGFLRDEALPYCEKLLREYYGIGEEV
ncbi:hypothetical protein HPP92_000656 [Vanilla planifolia]|uniref:Uncharacterized protein n=1 Tax=Vanilla planifolia TaxID=51239 RepID=A0A835RYH9_VANPL|nr:hypothetical protein HPP92_026809 [Vanilla planifolia]KAG0496094.1 hypothetical protein HPP92_000785 [Vanilla planifolia]KAG0500584.1 hypothetical protein HPP92_000656 [Vanilla planifolia]